LGLDDIDCEALYSNMKNVRRCSGIKSVPPSRILMFHSSGWARMIGRLPGCGDMTRWRDGCRGSWYFENHSVYKMTKFFCLQTWVSCLLVKFILEQCLRISGTVAARSKAVMFSLLWLSTLRYNVLSTLYSALSLLCNSRYTTMWDLRFSRRWLWRMPFFGI
jgi:hypothetical protein